MIICITSEGTNLDSKIHQHFGRAQYFIFYNDETKEFEAVKNQNIEGTSGVGIQSSQLVARKQAKIVLTGGSVGPKALQTLEYVGIKVIQDIRGSVQDAIDFLSKDSLES